MRDGFSHRGPSLRRRWSSLLLSSEGGGHLSPPAPPPPPPLDDGGCHGGVQTPPLDDGGCQGPPPVPVPDGSILKRQGQASPGPRCLPASHQHSRADKIRDGRPRSGASLSLSWRTRSSHSPRGSSRRRTPACCMQETSVTALMPSVRRGADRCFRSVRIECMHCSCNCNYNGKIQSYRTYIAPTHQARLPKLRTLTEAKRRVR